MKYEFDFFFDNGETRHYECDRYVFQGGAIVLENRREHEGKVLRTDEKYYIEKVVVFNHLLYFDVKERELQNA